MRRISSSIAQSLTDHLAWKALSWEVRGMAMHLMGMADATQGNTLAPEDDFWRNCLNIPTRLSVETGLKKSVGARGAKIMHETEIVWNEVWKKELLTWFILIDEQIVQTHPHLGSYLGRYTWPALEEEIQPVAMGSKSKRNKKPSEGTASKITGTDLIVDSTGTEQNRKAQRKQTNKKQSKNHEKFGFDPTFDYPRLSFTQSVLKKCWDVPLSQKQRADLWGEGVTFLTLGDETQEKTVRTFIGKLIKDFGEQKVAQALAQLMVRPVRPADCKSFLRKQLKNATEGSEAVQRARQQRVKVPL